MSTARQAIDLYFRLTVLTDAAGYSDEEEVHGFIMYKLLVMYKLLAKTAELAVVQEWV